MLGSVSVGIYFNVTDSKLYCGTSLTNLGATGVTVTTGVWYLTDLKINSSANPWTVDGRVGGTDLAQITTAQAANTNSSLVLGVDALASPTFEILYDDIAISNTLADYPLGAGQGWCGVPTADGTHNVAGAADFRRGGTTTDILNTTTDAYLLVDEVPLDDATPDADDHIRIVAPANVTDYVELVFGPAPGFVALTVAPTGVQVIGEVFAAGTGLSDEIIRLNDGGSLDIIYDGTGLAGVTDGTYKTKHYATAPSGGAWTAAKVNALRLRYGYANDANPDKSLMCAMLEVDIPPGVVASLLPAPPSESARMLLARY